MPSFYVYEFWTPVAPWLSDSQATWGDFGEYVGGTLGGLFGFFAFVAVLLTVYWQREQITLMREQADVDQLQRLLHHVAEVLDKRLAVEVTDFVSTAGISFAGRVSLFDAVAYGTMVVLNPKASQPGKKAVDRLNASLSLNMVGLLSELQQLARAIETYKAQGGTDEVARFYARRIAAYRRLPERA